MHNKTKIIKQHKVQSQSDPETVYTIDVWSDGFMTCECIAYAYLRKCKHVEFIKSKYYEK